MKRLILFLGAILVAQGIFATAFDNGNEKRIAKSKVTYKTGSYKVMFSAKLPRRAETVKFNEKEYEFAEGAFYVSVDSGYIVVNAPVGISVKPIPDDYQRVIISGQIFYYSQGIFFKPQGKKEFQVVYGPERAQVTKIPENSQMVKIKEQDAYLTNGAIFILGNSHTRQYYELVGYLEE